MESGALKHLIRTTAGCALFFGLVAPPLGGVLMFLLMAFGSGEWVGISLLDAGDLLGMAGFIGIFSYALGFLPACLAGAIAGIAHSGIRQLRWFLLLCAVVSAIAPGLLNADQRIFGAIAVLPGMFAGFLWWRRRLRDAPTDEVLHDSPSPYVNATIFDRFSPFLMSAIHQPG